MIPLRGVCGLFDLPYAKFSLGKETPLLCRASRPNGILTSFDFLNSRLSIAVVAPYMTALLLSVLKFLGFLESSVMLDL